MIQHWLRYMGLKNPTQYLAEFTTNNHTSSLLKYSQYAAYVSPTLLPEVYRSGVAEPRNLDHGNEELWRRIEMTVLNPHFAPLMATDLAKVSPAFVITSEFDVLRDDGIIYVERLRRAGVRVNLYHVKTSFHGFCSAYLFESTQFDICNKILPDVIQYIEENIH
ncbi:neutral cholesterol ester hydrolase 1-like [Gigantopelta aegis]|uniref:neutral cholesterol ester hydrolase 1-like n=1 Tax=Gigantopelta aegis TaxID=1735272 RepID=UPI001B88C85F|nr:neutral cholesterol ester hydrolase 1-like [Gigantopelta aegis]